MLKKINLKNKTALVTGAGKGLGKACAIALAEAGAKVIILTLFTAYLLQITGLRLIGGILLLYIVYKLYVDIIKGASNEADVKVDNSSFLKAIWTVLLADFTMSLDNVLGVAGAAGHHYHLLVFGLMLSIVLMAVAANLISGWIKKYKWIAWIGLLAILIVAIELIYTDIKILFL